MDTCHNHQHCINDALTKAHDACSQAGAKLTPLREKVLALIWRNHQPLGAYDLIDMLAESSERRIAPPTVYRTLDFLLNIGLIHRINSLNAYIGCSSPHTLHPSYFLICTHCKNASEITTSVISQAIDDIGRQAHFSIKQQWLEVLGVCHECAAIKVDG